MAFRIKQDYIWTVQTQDVFLSKTLLAEVKLLK